jgi:hypothetical protein
MLQLFRPKTKESRSLVLLRKGLHLCYTYKDVMKVQEVLQLSLSEITPDQLCDFKIEIIYRISLIEIVHRDYPEKRYEMHQLALLFKGASYAGCDALMLHVGKYKDNYRDRNEFGYDIFKVMWCKRKEELSLQFSKQVLQQKSSIFIKMQLLWKQLYYSKNKGYKYQRYGFE